MTIIYTKKIESVKISKAGVKLSYDIKIVKETPCDYMLEKVGCNKNGFMFAVIGEYKKPCGTTIYNSTAQYFPSVNKAMIAAVKIAKRIIKKHDK